MAHSVWHKELGEINLSELDLNASADRRLWESLYGKTRKGDLECLDCRERDPGCPQWMFLRLWRGRPVAVHYSRNARHPTAPESPRHKALKERIAIAAGKAGYSAELESRAPDGRRRTDVLVYGDNNLKLGCEIQLSYATAHSVAKRSDTARSDGLSPLWTTDDASAPLIDRAPWARIDRMPEEILRNGNALLIRGGVKTLNLLRCDNRNPMPCPDRGYGRCGQWHGTWAPVLDLHLDQLIGAAAAGEYVPLYLSAQPGRRGRASHMWVTTADREKYLDATGDSPTEPQPGTVDDTEPAAPENRPLSRECTYEQRLGAKKRRGATPRDTGESLPAGITITQSAPAPPEPRPTTFPSYIAAQHRTVPQPTVPGQSLAQPSTSPAAPPQRTPEPDEAALRRLPATPVPATSTRWPDRRILAAQLNCTPHQIGPCARCHEPTCRYGDGGNPLCRTCRDRRR